MIDHNDDEHWTDDAACRGVDPELFYPIGYAAEVFKHQEAQAKAVCGGCSVRAECLDWALRAGEPDGIWGGTTPEERRYLRRRIAAA
ncbi:WhiB family transcriptional regulator [Actinomadura craniellae]|uniref:Transcriptional regulator WhiB n=1 Tax=Actinomadura craniellae TaxID=2231787 RepID=A0A365H5V1_9ACTN|nr:WhiB family transcriptional regulator [Actinomadura craniellae]RAY13613.1 WhiB family transcriptional regulator [Actinomadura craniellae]